MMNDERTFYIVVGLWRFDESISVDDQRLRMPDDAPTHYLPVFLDRQSAEEWAEGNYVVVPLKPGDALSVIPAQVLAAK